MASRVLRSRHLPDLSLPRASQLLRRMQSVRGVNSQAVDSAFASQLGAVDVLATGPGQARDPDSASLYSLCVSTTFVR